MSAPVERMTAIWFTPKFLRSKGSSYHIDKKDTAYSRVLFILKI